MFVTRWERHSYIYIDDFGQAYFFSFNDYIGDAGGLKRAYPDPPPDTKRGHVGLHHRYLRVRSIDQIVGKRAYASIPVNVDNPLWTGNLGQRLKVGNFECETIKRVEEKEYGRAGAAAERRALKKHGMNSNSNE